MQFDSAIYDTIRKNIKKYRKEKGLTSAQLAELVDLSHDFIRQIESEKAHYNFSVETFYKISVALGTGMDKLAKNPKNYHPIFLPQKYSQKSCDIFNFQGDFYRFSRKKLKNHLTTSLRCIIMNMSVGTSDTPIDRIGPIWPS